MDIVKSPVAGSKVHISLYSSEYSIEVFSLYINQIVVL